MRPQFELILRTAIDRLIASVADKRIVVAGPGTGKTTVFRQLLEQREGSRDARLVLTFINNLKTELDEKIGGFARVFTFHGYCRHLLHQYADLRTGLSESFHYFPPLASIIRTDWVLSRGSRAPLFVRNMRRLEIGDETHFYMARANYYDAVGFDDSVFRVHGTLLQNTRYVGTYETIIVDEYQDFNHLEASFLDLLATRNPIIIAGDDDQALYSQLRGSSAQFIRALYHGGTYERFELPYCMRCTEVIVAAVADIVCRAREIGRLQGRIDKPYDYYPPQKADDSQRYPKLKIVETSVQSLPANYFGRYIEQQISQILPKEVEESRAEGFPTVLIIGPIQYLRQIRNYLESTGHRCEERHVSDPMAIERSAALGILRNTPEANLGWRVILEKDQPSFFSDIIRASIIEELPLAHKIPPQFRQTIVEEAMTWQEEPKDDTEPAPIEDERPTIKLTSFEGSKGLSGQHVFVVGLQEGDLPKNAGRITDLEICKFIVALTRTRKQCHLLHTKRWSGKPMKPSVFLKWIAPARKEIILINQSYWRTKRG